MERSIGAASPGTAKDFRKRAAAQQDTKKSRNAVARLAEEITEDKLLQKVEDRKAAADKAKREAEAAAAKRKENKRRAIEGLAPLDDDDDGGGGDANDSGGEKEQAETLHLMTEGEIDRLANQEAHSKKALRLTREVVKAQWICGICRQSQISGTLSICPACKRPRGAMIINNATTMDGVLETEAERKKVARRKMGQKASSKPAISTGKLSSLNTAGMSRQQRRIARQRGRQRAAQPSKKSKKKTKKKKKKYATNGRHPNISSDDDDVSEERQLTEAEKLIQASKRRANVYQEEKQKAGVNPFKRVNASFRSFFRRKLDESGTISKGLQNLMGDDYVAELKGIQRRPTCHYLPGLTQLAGLPEFQAAT
jgi:rubrerythrin